MIAGSLVFNWRVQARTEFVNATKWKLIVFLPKKYLWSKFRNNVTAWFEKNMLNFIQMWFLFSYIYSIGSRSILAKYHFLPVFCYVTISTQKFIRDMVALQITGENCSGRESVLGYSTISFIKTHATFFTFRLLSLLRKDHMTQNQLTLCDIKYSVPVSNL